MASNILVISNFRNSSMSYMSSLHGYGFDIEDTRTLEAAWILLRAGSQYDVIVIDVKFHADEIADFIHSVRSEISPTIKIVVVGCEYELPEADECLARPINFEDILQVLEPIH